MKNIPLFKFWICLHLITLLSVCQGHAIETHREIILSCKADNDLYLTLKEKVGIFINGNYIYQYRLYL